MAEKKIDPAVRRFMSELAKKRWAKMSKDKRKQHIKKMTEASQAAKTPAMLRRIAAMGGKAKHAKESE